MCDSFTDTFVMISGSIHLVFLFENITHYDQFCQFAYAWVRFMFGGHHSAFHIYHACPSKKNSLMLMPNELVTNFVNTHARVYVQWVPSFSISIMHAHLKRKKHVLCLGPAGFNLSKIHLCPGPRPGFTYDLFGFIPCL